MLHLQVQVSTRFLVYIVSLKILVLCYFLVITVFFIKIVKLFNDYTQKNKLIFI